MKTFTLNINGRLVIFERPAVMGILNVTPDSFYSQSRGLDFESVLARVQKLVDEGADIIDIGGYSTRPGHDDTPEQDELDRVVLGLKAVREIAPDIIVSVDTFRPTIARKAIEDHGADIINDVSGGGKDDEMFRVVADMHVPYILTNPGVSADVDTEYLMSDLLKEASDKLEKLSLMGVCDLIYDPGFGFGKTLEQNYQMLNNLNIFKVLHVPLLVGVSRKSMITSLLNTSADDALIGTTTINTIALQRGASILRVHDVAAAMQAVKIYTQLSKFPSSTHA